MALDLNALKGLLHDNQNRGDAKPSDVRRQVVVDNEGKVKMGTDKSPSEAVTEVPQEVFMAGSLRGSR